MLTTATSQPSNQPASRQHTQSHSGAIGEGLASNWRGKKKLRVLPHQQLTRPSGSITPMHHVRAPDHPPTLFLRCGRRLPPTVDARLVPVVMVAPVWVLSVYMLRPLTMLSATEAARQLGDRGWHCQHRKLALTRTLRSSSEAGGRHGCSRRLARPRAVVHSRLTRSQHSIALYPQNRSISYAANSRGSPVSSNGSSCCCRLARPDSASATASAACKHTHTHTGVRVSKPRHSGAATWQPEVGRAHEQKTSNRMEIAR
jgi:hypothetical protein